MFTVKELLRYWFSQKQAPDVNSLVMEGDLGRLQEQIRQHFPEAYSTSYLSQGGVIWAVHQSPRHHPWSIQETELAAWQEAAKWIPHRR